MIASVTADYVLLIPFAWLLGVHLGYALPGMYLAWTAFAALYALLFHSRYRRHFR